MSSFATTTTKYIPGRRSHLERNPKNQCDARDSSSSSSSSSNNSNNNNNMFVFLFSSKKATAAPRRRIQLRCVRSSTTCPTSVMVLFLLLLLPLIFLEADAFTPAVAGRSHTTTFLVLHQTPPFDDDGNILNGATDSSEGGGGTGSSSSSSSEDGMNNLKNGRSSSHHQQWNQTIAAAATPWLYSPSSSGSNNNNDNNNNNNGIMMDQQQQQQMLQRITQLEELVATQAVDISRLQRECQDLIEASASFARVVELLRQSGLDSNLLTPTTTSSDDIGKKDNNNSTKQQQEEEEKKNSDFSIQKQKKKPTTTTRPSSETLFLDHDSELLFGKAPASVLDAADAAGAAILAALLGGQQRLLVDVRDAELTSNPDTLVQFLELAVLPVAAGLEGLSSAIIQRNRLKIVFPTIKQLLEYRTTMALTAPDVVALSTLKMDPIETNDNLVVLLAPAPTDDEGLAVMNQLLSPETCQIRQPIIVFNPHMAPLQGPAAEFEVAYHLRLLSVQYMPCAKRPGSHLIQRDDFPPGAMKEKKQQPEITTTNDHAAAAVSSDNNNNNNCTSSSTSNHDAALEAALQHAKQGHGPGSGTTRAMVIRAYPNPWHVFVDTSSDTDADFGIAGTFEKIPTLEEIQRSIIECLEGTEEEDELVAQQMQHALELGQLDRISEILSEIMGQDQVDSFFDNSDDDDDGEDDDDDHYDPWGLHRGIDSV